MPNPTLTPDEARILGVLIEKALTTPNQYPLTLNSAADGASQKNNRFPVMQFDDDRVRDVMVALRGKGLVVQVDAAGSRASKFKHTAGEKLGLNTREIAVMAELLLRGPQTLGELRGRASRMHPLESLEVVRATLEQLMKREEPLVRELPPLPGSRAERYGQLLAPEAHPLDAAGGESPAASAASAPASGLGDRVGRLEAQVAVLRSALQRMARALGEPDPTTGPEFAAPAEASPGGDG